MYRLKALVIFLVVSLTVLSGCATSPTGRSQFILMPAADMDQMGLQSFENLKKAIPISKDPRANVYVRCVAETITREVEGNWEVVVFEDESPNAFALPGGKIGVHTGLLSIATNQHQLAAVIGHEIAHVLSDHSNERVSQKFAVNQGLGLIQAIAAPQSGIGQSLMALLGVGAQFGVILPFSRIHESEADILGLQLIANAGFDPRESINLWINMDRAGGAQTAEFLSTHPSHETRINDLEAELPYALELLEKAQAEGKNPLCERLG